jgi:hypothetical protein
MEYGGGYTSPDKLQKARSLYIKMLLALVPGAILCVYLFWP